MLICLASKSGPATGKANNLNIRIGRSGVQVGITHVLSRRILRIHSGTTSSLLTAAIITTRVRSRALLGACLPVALRACHGGPPLSKRPVSSARNTCPRSSDCPVSQLSVPRDEYCSPSEVKTRRKGTLKTNERSGTRWEKQYAGGTVRGGGASSTEKATF